MNEKVNQNKSALLYMVVAVVLFSALPITFSVGGASNAPFLFVALMYLSTIITNITYLFFAYPKKINRATLNIILNYLPNKAIVCSVFSREITLKNLPHPAIFWVVFGIFDYVVFAFALRYVDEAIAAVLIETSYIFTVILMARLFSKEDRYAKFTTQKWFLFTVAFIGVGFVIVSQSSTIDNAVSELFTYSALGGVGLVLVAALLAAIGLPANQKWGEYVSDNEKKEYEKKKGKKKKDDEKKADEIFYTIVASTIAKIIMVPVLVVAGLLSGESVQSIGGVGVLSAIAFGLFGLGVGTIFFRIANARTTNLGINVLCYLIPAVSLIWLALASRIDVPRIDWLVIGVTAIIVANSLLNAKAEIRSAYTALIIALWVCGMAVYLHDGLPLSNYAETIGVISTLFILILVFRADRLVRRTTDEEKSVFLVFHGLKTLARKEIMHDDALNQLRAIDEHTKPEQLRAAYQKLKKHFITAREQHPEHEEKLEQLEAEIDTLVHSKQQGVNFGELIALGFITFIMVSALLLFKPPELTGWDGLFIEILSFLLATVIVFLFANIFDLQHDRTNAILGKEKGSDFHTVAFDDATDRGGERWVSVGVCAAITLAYIWLFLGKWIF